MITAFLGVNYPFKISLKLKPTYCSLNIKQKPEHFHILCIAPVSFIYQSENEKKTA